MSHATSDCATKNPTHLCTKWTPAAAAATSRRLPGIQRASQRICWPKTKGSRKTRVLWRQTGIRVPRQLLFCSTGVHLVTSRLRISSSGQIFSYQSIQSLAISRSNWSKSANIFSLTKRKRFQNMSAGRIASFHKSKIILGPIVI